MIEDGDNPQLDIRSEEYINKVALLVERSLRDNIPANIVLETSGWGLREDSDYIRRILEHLPPQDWSAHIPNLDLILKYEGLLAVKKKFGIVERKPGGQPPGEILHSVSERYWREEHIVTPSSNLVVLYHSLGSESPGEYGGSGQFLTVNLTLEQIKRLSELSSTPLPQPESNPLAQVTHKKWWKFWQR